MAVICGFRKFSGRMEGWNNGMSEKFNIRQIRPFRIIFQSSTIPSLLFILLSFSFVFSQNYNGFFLDSLLKSHPEFFKEITGNINEYEVQIIYTRINRDERNIPSFESFSYHLSPQNYFYPASLVKLPVIAMSFEKINRMNKNGYPDISKYNTMITDSAYECQINVTKDTSAEIGLPSVLHYAKKMLLVSDNSAFNRLYEFLGQEYLNTRLSEMGYRDIRIISRFAPCDSISNRCTNPVKFYDLAGKLIYQQPLICNNQMLRNPLGTVKAGKAWKDAKGKMYYEPKDFTWSNYISIADMNRLLISIIFPEAAEPLKQFDLTADDYRLIRKYLVLYPRESSNPDYRNKKEYPDNFKKFFIYGGAPDTIREKNPRILNVVGRAYGWLSDCAYIVDFENRVEFFLCAVIRTNKSRILDGNYEYDETGMPFLKNLGRIIYQYELKRDQKFNPVMDNLYEEILK